MESPSPVPSYFRVNPESIWRKVSKIVSMSSALIPIPVSITRIMTLPSSVSHTILTEPFSVNFIALLSKFKRICSTLRESPGMVLISGAISHPSSSPLLSARGRILCSTFSVIWRKLMSYCANCNCPASILDMSRTSLINARRWWELFRTMFSCFFCSSFNGPTLSRRMMPVKPIIELSGVRSS